MADRIDIAYLRDLDGVATSPSGVSQGNLVIFGEREGDRQVLEDSQKKVADLVTLDTLGSSVQTATAGIWDAVKGEYAISAYKAQAWAQGVAYAEGSFCTFDGNGYRCKEAHTSSVAFDDSRWEVVLTPAGRQAIDEMLAAYSVDGMAALLNLAPRWNAGTVYSEGQLVLKEDPSTGKEVLQVCTKGGRGSGGAEFSMDATVEKGIDVRFQALKDMIPDKISDLDNDSGYITEDDIPSDVSHFTNDAGYVKGSTLDSEYDTSENGYEVGDTCTRGGEFYRCVRDVDQGSEWAPEDWIKVTVKEAAKSWSSHVQSDWDATDPSDPAYIQNKPEIPQQISIDDTLSRAGEAADAKAVGDRLEEMMGEGELSYDISPLAPAPSDDPTKMVFNLKNRTVNIINAEISEGRSIRLNPPASIGSAKAREFYLILDVVSANNVPVAVSGCSLEDYLGGNVKISAPSMGLAAYKFIETSTSGSVFTVTGVSDPAYVKILEVEKALDDILLDGGGGEWTPGIFVPDENGKYHKVTAVTDSETGEVNLGIDQEGVDRG